MEKKRLNAPALLEYAVEGLNTREAAIALKWGILGYLINKGATEEDVYELMECIQAQADNLKLLQGRELL